MVLSARNQLKGKVISINEGSVTAYVGADIGEGKIVTSSIATLEQIKFYIKDDDIIVSDNSIIKLFSNVSKENYRVDNVITGFLYKKRTSGLYQISNNHTIYKLTKI